MNECCLRYRYTLEDLIPLAKKLTKRTTSFEEWRIRVAEVFPRNGLTTGKRLDVSLLRELETAWRSGRYPQCDDIRLVQEAIGRFESVAAPITEIINRKMRLRWGLDGVSAVCNRCISSFRDNTRHQKADTRHEFAELEALRKQLEKCDIFDSSLGKAIEVGCGRGA